MRVRGNYRTSEFFALYAKIFRDLGLPLPGVSYILGRSRPRTPIPVPTSAEQAAAVDNIAGILAGQRVASGKATSYADEKASIKNDLTANPPDPAKIHEPKTKKSTTKPNRQKKPKRKQKPRTDSPKSALEWLEQAAAVLTTRRQRDEPELDYTNAYNASLAELKDGRFNPDHWKECEQLEQSHLSCVPVTGPDLKIRSYAFPLADKKRTLAVYGNGTEATGPARYSGNVLAGEFRDSLLVWSRTTFKLVNKIEEKQVEPTFIEVTGSIRAYADRRGSRPMLSWVSRTRLAADGSSYLTSPVPPTNKPWSWYYRYKIPHTEAPFYQTVELKKAIRTMMQPKHMEAGATLEKAVVMIAPRPMYGRGFNNNDSVTTQFLHEIKIWQIDLTPRDRPNNHVHLFSLPYQGDFSTVTQVMGLTMKSQHTVIGGSDWNQSCIFLAQDFHELPAEKKAAWAAGAAAVINGNKGTTFSLANKTVGPMHDAQSPWMTPDSESRNAWHASEGLDNGFGNAYVAFIWFERANTFIALGQDAYYLDANDQMGVNYALLAAHGGPGVQLFAGYSQYQP